MIARSNRKTRQKRISAAKKRPFLAGHGIGLRHRVHVCGRAWITAACLLLLGGWVGCGPKAVTPVPAPRLLNGKELVRLALASPQDFPFPSAAAGIPDSPREPRAAGRPPAGTKFSLRLKDGTQIGGTLFSFAEPDAVSVPLLIAGFGFLQDRWGEPADRFAAMLAPEKGRPLEAYLLILDSPSSGPFLAANAVLSPGSYDEARMWIEVASHLKTQLHSPSVHLIGFALSGQAVVHALAEDVRLQLDLFTSGIAVSIVPEFQQTYGRALALFDTADGIHNPWDRNSAYGGSGNAVLQKALLEKQIKTDFIAGYLRVNPDHATFRLHSDQVAVFFHRAMENRIAMLRSRRPASDTWNRTDFSLENLDAYLETTSTARAIDRVRRPLVLLYTRSDPTVSRPLLLKLERAAAANPWVLSHGTNGPDTRMTGPAEDTDALQRLLELMTDPRITDTWIEVPTPPTGKQANFRSQAFTNPDLSKTVENGPRPDPAS
jgi:hypothetical protein